MKKNNHVNKFVNQINMKDMGKCHEKLLYINTGHQFKVLCLTASLSCVAGLTYANSNSAVSNIPAVNQNAVQNRMVKGNVVDETGMPMIGVSVVAVGTTSGTITDYDGNFSLEMPAGKNALEFSYIGYQKKTVQAASGKTLSVKMDAADQSLDEVVVVGYGTIKKRDLTGAVTSVKSSDITLSPGNNPMEALQGRVAGLDITRSSGQPGAGVNMQLRGTRSLSSNGNPLFIIDGMPGDYATLNPNDIESIEVLKDASSTAVYGAEGANGVIIITTKKGNEGKMSVNVNLSGGYNGWSTLPEMRSGDSYINVLREAKEIAGNYSDDEALFSSPEAYKAHLDNKYINWADALMQDGYTQNYSVSVSGGTEKTKGYFSLNFADEQGQYSGDNYKVYSTKMSIDHKVNKWISTGVNLQGSYVYQNKAYAKLVNALTTTPLGELYDENGDLNVTPVAGDGNTINLLLSQDKSVYRNNVENFKVYFTPYIEVRPFKGFTVQSRLNTTLNYNTTNYFQGIGSYQYYMADGADAQGTSQSVYARITRNNRFSYKWENIFTYNFNINDAHNITLTGVSSWSDSKRTQSWQQQDNIKNNSYLWHNMESNVNAKSYSNYEMSKALGFIGRVNYSYKSRYLFSASVRHDGVSALADGNRWSTFPAGSLGWVLTEESFMESTKSFLDNLKIRVGYGITGGASIPSYSSVATVDDGYYSLGGEQLSTMFFSKNITNTDLTWERSHNTNIGIDASFLNRRIDITADYFKTKTTGVIWAQTIPITNGGFNASTQYTVYRNIAETENNGLELGITTRNIVKKNFKWDTSLTFTINDEKVKKIVGGTSNNIANSGTDYTLSIGEFVNSYYNYKIDGIWQTGEAAEADIFGCKPGDIKINVPGLVKVEEGKYYKNDKDGKPVTDDNGDIIYYTADNKYTYSGSDYQTIGHNAPKWTMGIQNKFIYKNFDLTVYAYFRWGQMIKYDMLGYYDPSGAGNFPKYFNYWTESNPSNDFPGLNADRSITSYIGSGALSYVDGSFFKIKNITLGYTLPASLQKKLGISNCRVFGTLTNPFVFAKSHLLKDYDPEMNGSLNYPLTKQLVFGVNLSF